MRSFPATGAAAAVVLMAAAGAALALPPEPASAPAGAHTPAAPPNAGAAAPASGAPGLPPGTSNDPIDITSEGVEVIQPQHLTIFKGNVEETQGQQRLRTPELRVYNKPKQTTQGQPAAQAGAAPMGADAGSVDKIEAAGPVYYITPTQNARADYMLYEATPDTITMTGHVVLVQGKSVAKGDKFIMYRKTGQNQLISNSPQTAQGRVRVILYPSQQPQPGAASAKPGSAPPAAR